MSLSKHDKKYNKHEKVKIFSLKRRWVKLSLHLMLIFLLFIPDSINIIGMKGSFGWTKATAATAQSQITVNAANFQQYFTLKGSSNGTNLAGLFDTASIPRTAEYSYNAASPSIDPTTGNPYGTLTITSANNNQVGMATFNQNFDTSQNWTLTGQLNVGTSGGADGVSFGWAPSTSIGKVGASGDQLGIGGLKGAFGWTANTYQNDARSLDIHTLTDSKPTFPTGWTITQTQNADGSWTTSGDPNSSSSSSWGQGGFAFASPTLNGNKGTPSRYDLVSYNRSDAPAQSILSLEDGHFHSFVISYVASTGMVTTTFGTLTWSIPIGTLEALAGDTSATALSFFISGSTGGLNNLQQFRFESLSYAPAPESTSVTVNYVDQNGNVLAPPIVSTGTVGAAYSTNPLGGSGIPAVPSGYVFSNVTSTDATTVFNSTTNVGTGKYLSGGTVVTYVYQKIVPATVTYIDDTTGQTLKTDSFTNISNPTYTTASSISSYQSQGYQLVSDSTTGISNLFANSTGVANNYVVHLVHTYTAVDLHTTTETINYLLNSDKTTVVAPNYNAAVSFVSVKDNVTRATTGPYYTNGTVSNASTITINSSGQITSSGWTSGSSVTLNSVNNPSVTYNGTVQEVVSTDDPTNTVPDLTKTLEQTINATNQPNLTINVYYAPLTHIVTSSKTITRTITYVDANDNKIVLGTATPEKVTFTASAVEDSTGKILGYDTNGDGSVDVSPNGDGSIPTNAWVPDTVSNGDFAAVTSPSYASEGYGNPSQSVVPELAADASLADGTVIKVVVTYPYSGGQNITLPFTGGEGMFGLAIAAASFLGLAFIVRRYK